MVSAGTRDTAARDTVIACQIVSAGTHEGACILVISYVLPIKTTVLHIKLKLWLYMSKPYGFQHRVLCTMSSEVLCLFVFVLHHSTVFQLYHGCDMMYEMRKRKPEPKPLLTQEIFNLPHHIGMV